MSAGGMFTLFHVILWQLKITPDEFMKKPRWARDVIVASVMRRNEELKKEKENQANGGES